MKGLKKVKIIGFPFSANANGACNTPQWLKSQIWFNNLSNIEYEQVQVQQHVMRNQSGYMETVINNCQEVGQHTSQAIKDGYYPIIIGGDGIANVGTISAVKRLSPQAKTLWLDSIVDMPLQFQQDKLSSLQFLAPHLVNNEEQVPTDQFKCLDVSNDIAIIGAKKMKGPDCSFQNMQREGAMMISNFHCMYQSMDEIHSKISKEFSQGSSSKQQEYWISFNAHSFDQNEFQSKTGRDQKQTNTMTVDFFNQFMESFGNQSIGLSISDIEFNADSKDSKSLADEQTVREMLEVILETINMPAPYETNKLDFPMTSSMVDDQDFIDDNEFH